MLFLVHICYICILAYCASALWRENTGSKRGRACFYACARTGTDMQRLGTGMAFMAVPVIAGGICFDKGGVLVDPR